MLDSLGRSIYRVFAWDPKPYITFRNVTIAVFVLWVWNLSFILWKTPKAANALSFIAAYYAKGCALTHSPWLVLLNVAFVGLGFWIVRRYRHKHYFACLTFYGMLLADVLGMFDAFISCYLFFR